ncbi:MAG TPA: hypothetical protein VGH53_12405 [Streptosporangiaceae bacterium]
MLRGGMGTRSRAVAAAPWLSALLVVATGPYAGEGLDCPALDTLRYQVRRGGRAADPAAVVSWSLSAQLRQALFELLNLYLNLMVSGRVDHALDMHRRGAAAVMTGPPRRLHLRDHAA